MRMPLAAFPLAALWSASALAGDVPEATPLIVEMLATPLSFAGALAAVAVGAALVHLITRALMGTRADGMLGGAVGLAVCLLAKGYAAEWSAWAVVAVALLAHAASVWCARRFLDGRA